MDSHQGRLLLSTDGGCVADRYEIPVDELAAQVLSLVQGQIYATSLRLASRGLLCILQESCSLVRGVLMCMLACRLEQR